MSARGPISPRRVVLAVAYWAAVLAVSLALVIVLLLFFEARDASQLNEGATSPRAAPRLA